MNALLYWLKHPGLSLFAGAVLFASGLAEAWEAYATGEVGFGAHHGAVVFGLLTVAKAGAELLEGLVKIEDAALEGSTLGEARVGTARRRAPRRR